MQSPQRQYAAYCESRDPKGTGAKIHPGQGRARQQGCQNDNGNSNAGLRHGTLRTKPDRVTLDDAERKRKFPVLAMQTI
jgi:hypothetical protein